MNPLESYDLFIHISEYLSCREILKLGLLSKTHNHIIKTHPWCHLQINLIGYNKFVNCVEIYNFKNICYQF